MAVAFDAASNSGALTSVASANWSHTCTGANRALFVGTGSSSGGGGAATTSITYNSVSMTELWDVVSQQGVLANSGYILAAPATGANTIAVTWGATADELGAGAMSFTGVDQATPNDAAPTPATSAGATPATINVSSAAGDMVADNVYIGAATAITVGADQTSRWEIEDIGGFAASGGSHEAGAATVTMSWTLAGGSLPWVIGAVNLNAAAAGGTVNTATLTDTIVVGDERVSGMVRNHLLGDTLTISEGPTVISTIHGYIFSDEILVSDASAQFFVRTRVESSGIVITDELLASIVGNAILTRVLSDDIVVTDGTIWSAIRGRILQDTITLSEGATEIYTTTNMLATDEVLLDDSLIVRRWLTRLLTDGVALTDEAIAAIVGQNVLTRLLTDTIETVDEALVWCQRHRVGESMVLTTDEIVKVMRWTRELTDRIDLADENLTALQRFIMLSDALTVSDSAIASINPQPDDFVTPTIRIGFDQPRIVIGGYAVN